MNQIKFRVLLFTICAALAGVSGCKKPYDYDKEVAVPIATPEKLAASLNGYWEMQTALEIDEKSLIKESMDISDFLNSGGKSPNITFHADYTFSVDTPGLLINYFRVEQGKWAFDDARYPTKVILTDLSENPVSEITIGSNLVGISPRLSYISSVDCGETKALSYNITLIKK